MSIAPVVAERAEEIREICRAHGVKRLDLFGSAATGEFDPERSDVDFLVTFHKGVRRGWMGEYFDLRQALEELLGRPVDLVSDHEFRNPYFRDAVEESRTPLYADQDDQVPVGHPGSSRGGDAVHRGKVTRGFPR